MKEQEIQQKLVLYQLLTQRIEQLNEQARLIEQRLLELETTRQALADLGKAKQGSEVLIPLGSGCYTYGMTGDFRKLLLDMGAGVMMNKSPAEAGKAIEEKKAEIEEMSQALQKEANDIVEKMNELVPELQRFLQQAGKEEKEEPAGAG